MARVPGRSWIVFFLLLIAFPLAPQERPWAGLRHLGSDEMVVFLKVLKTEGNSLMMVPLDYRFGPTDHFVFEISPTRGGYVALYGLGAGHHLKQRIWPTEAAGYPVTAQSSTRLPPVHSLSLSGQGQTRLAVLFSLAPLAGGGPSPPSSGSAPEPPRRWLKQIRLRDVVLNPASLPEVPVAAYQGALAVGKPVGIQIELQLTERRP